MTVLLTQEHRAVRHARVVGPASYATGGDPITPGDFALSRIDHLIVSGGAAGGYVVAYDATNSKLKWLVQDGDAGALVEATAATNLTGEFVDVIAIGLP